MDTLYNIKGNRRKRLASSHFVFSSTWTGGRSEVTWRPGARSRFGAPWSNLKSFGSKSTVMKKVLATLLGLFGAPRSDSVPGALFPLTPPLVSLRR